MAATAGTENDSGCTASKLSACMLCWQQLCDAGIRMLPQLPFIFLQQACSCAVI